MNQAWEVFLLFLIPIGGGIPAGVLLADKYGLSWPIMIGLYAVSDVVLACVFEPMMLLFLKHSSGSPKLMQFREVFKKALRQITNRYGINPGPFSLVMITVGTDPMTGRVISKIAGHGFITGWILTILGDLIFFSIIMASTLWLNNIVGDGTIVTIIILTAMFVVPALFRKLKESFLK